MKGAVRALKQTEMINLPDPVLVMDADTPEDYKALLSYAKSREVPSDIVCMKLHKFFNTKNNVQKHCLKVAETAVSIAETLNKNGYQLDNNKIKAAALLHDILRYRKDQAKERANLLEDLGCSGISEIVRDHMELREYDVYHITEKSVVYLADKLVKEDSPISLEEHFINKLQQYKNGGDEYKSVEKRYKKALQIKNIMDMTVKSNIAL